MSRPAISSFPEDQPIPQAQWIREADQAPRIQLTLPTFAVPRPPVRVAHPDNVPTSMSISSNLASFDSTADFRAFAPPRNNNTGVASMNASHPGSPSLSVGMSESPSILQLPGVDDGTTIMTTPFPDPDSRIQFLAPLDSSPSHIPHIGHLRDSGLSSGDHSDDPSINTNPPSVLSNVSNMLFSPTPVAAPMDAETPASAGRAAVKMQLKLSLDSNGSQGSTASRPPSNKPNLALHITQDEPSTTAARWSESGSFTLDNFKINATGFVFSDNRRSTGLSNVSEGSNRDPPSQIQTREPPPPQSFQFNNYGPVTASSGPRPAFDASNTAPSLDSTSSSASSVGPLPQGGFLGRPDSLPALSTRSRQSTDQAEATTPSAPPTNYSVINTFFGARIDSNSNLPALLTGRSTTSSTGQPTVSVPENEPDVRAFLDRFSHPPIGGLTANSRSSSAQSLPLLNGSPSNPFLSVPIPSGGPSLAPSISVSSEISEPRLITSELPSPTDVAPMLSPAQRASFPATDKKSKLDDDLPAPRQAFGPSLHVTVPFSSNSGVADMVQSPFTGSALAPSFAPSLGPSPLLSPPDSAMPAASPTYPLGPSHSSLSIDSSTNLLPQSANGSTDDLTGPASPSRIYVRSLSELKVHGNAGQGSSGVVQQATHIPTGRKVALKVLAVENNLSDKKAQQMITEVRTLHVSRSPFIVGFYGAFYKDAAISMVLEYMDAGSLLDLYKAVKRVPEQYLSAITVQVLKGLQYLHRERNVIHRDIKPSNILINLQGQVKLADFGVSGEADPETTFKTSFVGTVTYMSPERIKGNRHTYNSDLWSLGLALMECAQGHFPYLDPKQKRATGMGFWDIMDKITNNPSPTFAADSGFTPEFKDFIDRCLQKDSDKRAEVEELLDHPWLAKYANPPVDLASYVRDAKEVHEKEKKQQAMASLHGLGLGLGLGLGVLGGFGGGGSGAASFAMLHHMGSSLSSAVPSSSSSSSAVPSSSSSRLSLSSSSFLSENKSPAPLPVASNDSFRNRVPSSLSFSSVSALSSANLPSGGGLSSDSSSGGRWQVPDSSTLLRASSAGAVSQLDNLTLSSSANSDTPTLRLQLRSRGSGNDGDTRRRLIPIQVTDLENETDAQTNELPALTTISSNTGGSNSGSRHNTPIPTFTLESIRPGSRSESPSIQTVPLPSSDHPSPVLPTSHRRDRSESDAFRHIETVAYQRSESPGVSRAGAGTPVLGARRVEAGGHSARNNSTDSGDVPSGSAASESVKQGGNRKRSYQP